MNRYFLLIAIAVSGIVNCGGGESVRGDYLILQNFDQLGSPYETLQTRDTHNGNATLNAPKIVSGGPFGNYLELAQRDVANSVDATNAILFSNASTTAGDINFSLKYHMQGVANGFGFVLLDTSEYGASGESLALDTTSQLQIEQSHNHDAVGTRQSAFYRKSLHIALQNFEDDRVQIFYDGFKLHRESVYFGPSPGFSPAWYDLNFSMQFLPNETVLKIDSKYLATNTPVFNVELRNLDIAPFISRPLLGARIGGAGSGNYFIDSFAFQQTSAVPEPSSLLLLGMPIAYSIVRRRFRGYPKTPAVF